MLTPFFHVCSFPFMLAILTTYVYNTSFTFMLQQTTL